jgi:large subunit ribosomal protein L24
MQDIRKNDTVMVISGDDEGKQGRVLRVMPADGRVLIEGVNYIWRHVRPSQKNPQGGRVQKEAPVALSKVMLLCPECSTGRKVKHQGKGREKERVCSKCGHLIAAPAK